MILYTIQPLDVWNSLQQNGILYADPLMGSHVEFDNPNDDYFYRAYLWMREQMELRTSEYKGNWMWWAWHTWCYRNDKPIGPPDLRTYKTFFPKGEINVRIKLNIPDEKVLLSCYSGWHCVLNSSPICFTEEEENEFFKQRYTKTNQGQKLSLKDLKEIMKNPPPETKEDKLIKATWDNMVKATWERVFDLEWMKESMYEGGDQVQACFEELNIDNVLKAEQFVGTGKYWKA